MAYKKLSEATLVESISDVANILIEENDEIKRVPKDELGGCSCPEILETVGGDTLTWDGNTEGLDTYSNVYYRVSDVSPTMNDFVNGGTIKKSDGTIIEFKNYHANEDMGKINIYMGEIYVFLTEQNGIPAGVYFRNLNGAYVTSFTINGYTGFPKEQVKQEYLPEADLVIRINGPANSKVTVNNMTIVKGDVLTVKEMFRTGKCPNVVLHFIDGVGNTYWCDNKKIKGEPLIYAGQLYIGYVAHSYYKNMVLGQFCFNDDGTLDGDSYIGYATLSDE